MKDYFINLINYDKHTNLQLLQYVFEAGQPEKAVQLMAHMLKAQQVWLARCKDEPMPAGVLWPDWQATAFQCIIEENHAAWIEFLSKLTNGQLSLVKTYQNSKGESFQNSLSDILAHLINHGTHHRAQIGMVLKQIGLEELPGTDLILYIRGQKQ